MAGKGAVLASRILNEVSSLGLVVARVENAWEKAAANNDEFYFDSVALPKPYHIMPDKMKPLAKSIHLVFKQVEKELSAFSRFIQSR